MVIAGGGPVGLFLAICLLKSGIECRILEKRTEIDQHSKSIGIHPVSMELFNALGIEEKFLQEGLKIFNGHAYVNSKKAGTVSFESCPLPYNFILALPQNKTEEILENELKRIESGCLKRGTMVKSFSQNKDFVDIKYLSNGKLKQTRASWLVGCDGKNSVVRNSAGIKIHGKEYPDSYIMGDYTDNTKFGADAAVYLHRDGLIECFPLPGGMRRWVIKTDNYIENPSRKALEQILKKRLNVNISKCEMTMISSFRVQHFISSTFCKKRVLLAGDSAQVVSPIGGQGMNLGWITACNLAETLQMCLNRSDETNLLIGEWSDYSSKIGRQAARRAEMNMWLGRKQSFPLFRALLLRILINTPVQKLMSRIFTMRGLGKWPV